MAFLYDILLQEFGKRAIAQVAVPNHITDNLKPGFGQRPYQIEAFQRFILWFRKLCIQPQYRVRSGVENDF